jgi:outer membrane protein TolC
MPKRQLTFAITALLGMAGCATRPETVASTALSARSAPAHRESTSKLAAPIAKANYIEPDDSKSEPLAAARPVEATGLEAEQAEDAPTNRQTVSLAAILQQAESQNPTLAFARERINEAYSRVDRSHALWVPSLRAGLNFNHHEGAIQDVAGAVFDTSRRSMYGGIGALAVGAGAPAVPGLLAQFHLTDAIFQPRIAEHQAASRQFGAAAVRNDTLRDAAVAYLELARAEYALAIAVEAHDHTAKLAAATDKFASAGQGLESDRERMAAELALREGQLAARQEAALTASAQLAQILHADSSITLTSDEPAIEAIDFINCDDPIETLVALGLSQRPELCEQRHLVAEAVERIHREAYAPLIPSVLLGLSYGGLGGRIGGDPYNSGDRWDADAAAYWELRNLGFGDRAAQREMSSAARQAQFREVAVLDRIAREITEAHAKVIKRRKRIEAAKKGILAAERSYSLNLKRIENVQGLPIEALQAIQALAAARQNYLDAVLDYNVAQVELCRAAGWIITETLQRTQTMAAESP